MKKEELQRVLAELPEIRDGIANSYAGKRLGHIPTEEALKLCDALQAAADEIENISKENARLRESLVECADAHEYYKENQRLQAEIKELEQALVEIEFLDSYDKELGLDMPITTLAKAKMIASKALKRRKQS